MAAPQANAMAAVIDPLMMGGETPWLLYGVGAILALLLNWLKVPALPFSLGTVHPLAAQRSAARGRYRELVRRLPQQGRGR